MSRQLYGAGSPSGATRIPEGTVNGKTARAGVIHANKGQAIQGITGSRLRITPLKTAVLEMSLRLLAQVQWSQRFLGINN